jgi:hypothetical protein
MYEYFRWCWESHELAVAEGDETGVSFLEGEHDRIVRAINAGETEITPAVTCCLCGDLYVPDEGKYNAACERGGWDPTDRECPDCKAAMEKYLEDLEEQLLDGLEEMYNLDRACLPDSAFDPEQSGVMGDPDWTEVECDPACPYWSERHCPSDCPKVGKNWEPRHPDRAYDPEDGHLVTSIHQFTVDAAEERRL